MKLRDLSPASRMYAVYAAYGQAMISAHALEKRLEALVIAQVDEALTPSPNRVAEVERVRRLTLGQLIGEFSSRHNPSEALAEQLAHTLLVRNDLAHRIAITVLVAAREHEWEEQLIQELLDYTELFRDTGELLTPYVAAWFDKHSVDRDILLSAAMELYPGVRHEA